MLVNRPFIVFERIVSRNSEIGRYFENYLKKKEGFQLFRFSMILSMSCWNDFVMIWYYLFLKKLWKIAETLRRLQISYSIMKNFLLFRRTLLWKMISPNCKFTFNEHNPTSEHTDYSHRFFFSCYPFNMGKKMKLFYFLGFKIISTSMKNSFFLVSFQNFVVISFESLFEIIIVVHYVC